MSRHRRHRLRRRSPPTCGAIASRRRGWDVEVVPVPALLHNRPGADPPGGRGGARGLRPGGGRVRRLRHLRRARRSRPPRLDAAHCYDMFGREEVRAALEEEPGTYILTDFLARTFEHTVWRELGLDRWPELRDDYFGHYTRVLWLAQRPTPATRAAAERAAAAARPPAGRARGRRRRARARPRGPPHLIYHAHDRLPLRLRDRRRRVGGLRAGQPAERGSGHARAGARGGPQRLPWDVLIHMPAALAFALGNRFYDWRYESEPEPHMQRPADRARAREGARRVELDQRDDLPARQPAGLRALGGRPRDGDVGLRALPAVLQADGELPRGRRRTTRSAATTGRSCSSAARPATRCSTRSSPPCRRPATRSPTTSTATGRRASPRSTATSTAAGGCRRRARTCTR